MEVMCSNDGQAEDQSANPDDTHGSSDPVETLIDQAFAIMAPLGFGGIFGFATGYALKKVGEQAAYVVGLTFLGLQGTH